MRATKRRGLERAGAGLKAGGALGMQLLWWPSAALVLLSSTLAWGQADGGSAAPYTATAAPWMVGASVSGYFFESESDYVQPTLTLDHGILHLEARYNYEAQRTGSLWVGLNFFIGKTVKFEFTPMAGGVFGDVMGIALGLEWTLAWGPLSWFSELEFVFDLVDYSQDNFNVWSQATWQPFPWADLGIGLQRTRAHAGTLVVDVGPCLGFNVWKLNLTGCWLDPWQSSSQYWMVTLGLAGVSL